MADVVVELSGNEKKLLDSYRRLAEAEARQLAGLDAVSKKSQQAEDAGSKMAKSLIADAKSIAIQYLSVQSAIALATKAYEHHEAKANAAVQRGEQLADVNRRLRQVSPTGDTSALSREANALTSRTGLNPESARQLLYDASNAGLLEDKPFLEKLARGDHVFKSGEAMSAASSLTTFFKSLSRDDALDLITVGASNAKISMEQFTPAMQEAMESGQRTAIKPEEIAAALAMTSFNVNAPGTNLNALLGMTASNDELKKMGLPGQIKALAADESLREEVLKDNKKAIATFEMLLNNLNKLVDKSASIGDAVYRTDAFDMKIRGSFEGEDGERLAATLQAYRLEQDRIAGYEEKYGTETRRWQAVRSMQTKVYGDNIAADNLNTFSRFAGWMRGTTALEALEGMASEKNPDRGIIGVEGMKALREAADEMRGAAAALNGAGGNYSAAQRARSQTQKDPG
jgi:hypothetical protein